MPPGTPGRGAGRGFTPDPAAREALRKWRLTVPLDGYRRVRKKFEDAGLLYFSHNLSFRDDFTDEEIDRGFQMAEALGTRIITASSPLTVFPRLQPFAEKYKFKVALHNHGNPPEDFEQVIAMSPNFWINLDVGHFFASQEEIEYAAEKSLASEVVARLEGGYDQMLGRRFEGGVDLSGGEWQKLALARAYLRDAQLLILDEPTASLDARSEFEVFERFAELTFGKMALLISHRFSTVRMADRIVVLEGGKLVEEGSHAQLLALGGRYAAMFEMQAANYR